MNQVQFVNISLAKLDQLLVEQFRADARDFAGRARGVAASLPDELAQPLAELAEAGERLKAEPAAEAGRFAEFAFRCGQVYEQLTAQRRIEMEMENVRVGPASVEPAPLQGSQADLVARFIEARDRMFRKVADFTLKALLVVLGLLTLGLILGLV
jgi:hypothetical protein